MEGSFKGVKNRINSETDLIYVLFTRLFGNEDLERVHQLQTQFKDQTFLNMRVSLQKPFRLFPI
jgi:hypothetical protein